QHRERAHLADIEEIEARLGAGKDNSLAAELTATEATERAVAPEHGKVALPSGELVRRAMLIAADRLTPAEPSGDSQILQRIVPAAQVGIERIVAPVPSQSGDHAALEQHAAVDLEFAVTQIDAHCSPSRGICFAEALL